ncbi:MAG: hypothetical protein ABR608_00205 [Pseudonocardiaceae bacterium]
MRTRQKAALAGGLLVCASALAVPGIATAATTPAGVASAQSVVAPMGGCGDTRNVYTSGAEAHWTINCGAGQVSVTGWVKDTDADGQCAQVYAHFPANNSWKYSAKACPKGTVKEFTLTGPGSSADVYLREIG